MRIVSKLTGGVAALAMIAAWAAPAAAQGRGWGGWQGGHRHHDRGPDAGTVIGVIAAVGIFAAIASAATKKKQATERSYDAPPQDYGYYDNGAPRPRDDRAYDDGARYDSRSTAPRYESQVGSDEDAAVDACAIAARDRASGGSNYAEVRGINGVTARGIGYEVTGQIEQRSSYRATDGWSRNFRCSWTDGRVSTVTVD